MTAAARRRSLGGKRKSRGSPTTTDATGPGRAADERRRRHNVAQARSLTTDDGVAARGKRRRSLEGAPLFSPPEKDATPAKASPGAAELGFFSPAASAKRSKAWSVRASARRAADAWADHDGWFPSSKGDEAAFLALVESRGCPPAKRLEAWAAWAGNEPTELLLEVRSMRRSRRKLARTSSGRCGVLPTLGTAMGPSTSRPSCGRARPRIRVLATSRA